MNHIILIGRLTRDPELRYTSNSLARTTFTLAVDRHFANSRGQHETDFINIVTWRQLAEICAEHLKKGRLAAVEGRLEIRSFENNEGQRIKMTEVVANNVQFLDNKNKEPVGPSEDPFAPAGNTGDIDISDDDLPF